MMRETLVFQVGDSSQVGETRRAACALAEDLGFDATSVGKLAIIVAEAATNLVKHSGGGEVLLQVSRLDEAVGIDIIVIDRGKGMADVAASMRDGHSTAGTLGGGLGAMQRLSHEFDILSEPGRGTVLAARLWHPGAPRAAGRMRTAALNIPYPGERTSGDAWAVRRLPGRTFLSVIDGLGHGPGATEASDEALRIFDSTREERPSAIMRDMHDALKKTRGCVAGVAVLDHDEMTVTYSGVGNIVAFIARGDTGQNLLSHDGTLGFLAPRFQDNTYAWTSASVLVMHSDGLSTRCRPENMPLLVRYAPGVIAGSILRDCKRNRDDTTILVAREAREP